VRSASKAAVDSRGANPSRQTSRHASEQTAQPATTVTALSHSLSFTPRLFSNIIHPPQTRPSTDPVALDALSFQIANSSIGLDTYIYTFVYRCVNVQKEKTQKKIAFFATAASKLDVFT
jgi:hypothetical protein